MGFVLDWGCVGDRQSNDWEACRIIVAAGRFQRSLLVGGVLCDASPNEQVDKKVQARKASGSR